MKLRALVAATRSSASALLPGGEPLAIDGDSPTTGSTVSNVATSRWCIACGSTRLSEAGATLAAAEVVASCAACPPPDASRNCPFLDRAALTASAVSRPAAVSRNGPYHRSTRQEARRRGAPSPARRTSSRLVVPRGPHGRDDPDRAIGLRQRRFEPHIPTCSGIASAIRLRTVACEGVNCAIGALYGEHEISGIGASGGGPAGAPDLPRTETRLARERCNSTIAALSIRLPVGRQGAARAPRRSAPCARSDTLRSRYASVNASYTAVSDQCPFRAG